MVQKKLDPREVAFWRYERIEEVLSEELTHVQRGRIVERISRTPVLWPFGETRRISQATLYRWIEEYREGGLEALEPKERKDWGVERKPIRDEVIDHAIRLLTADPGMTLPFLVEVLAAQYPDCLVSRSTLQRRLATRPEYRRILEARTREPGRKRFVGKAIHDIWHMDAKGPISVMLVSGVKLLFHVLSILDDVTRAVLATLIVLTPNLAAAIRVFRLAALRYGLPNRFYADRASIFDAIAFRQGLAILGVHRIQTKAGNAPAHGKIEAYHRTLAMWFADRLVAQPVVDMVHLQQLLDGVIYGLYQTHRHRGLKMAPAQVLGTTVSPRTVPPSRLYDAFVERRTLKAHPKTGEVCIEQVTYLVPSELRGKRLTFLVDRPGEVSPRVVWPGSGAVTELERAVITVEDRKGSSTEPFRVAEGPLQAIYDRWQGIERPQAEPGFGLPELHALLTSVVGRHVPQSDAEAVSIMNAYRAIGPLPRAATEKAFEDIQKTLGMQRPIATYLDALASRIHKTTETP